MAYYIVESITDRNCENNPCVSGNHCSGYENIPKGRGFDPQPGKSFFEKVKVKNVTGLTSIPPSHYRQFKTANHLSFHLNEMNMQKQMNNFINTKKNR